MKFKFTIDGKIFHANMIENDITKEIQKHLPFEATYTRYTEHEYYTRLPFKTSDKKCKKEFEANKNEVWYFGGWNAFTILFGDCNTYPFEVVKLGDVEEDISKFLENKGQTIKILCEDYKD